MRHPAVASLSARLLDYMLENTHLCVAVLDRHGHVLEGNPPFLRLTGVVPGQQELCGPGQYLAPVNIGEMVAAVNSCLDGGAGTLQVTLVARDGIYHDSDVELWPGQDAALAVMTPQSEAHRGPLLSTGGEARDVLVETLNMELYRARRFLRPVSLLVVEVSNSDALVREFGEAAAARVLAATGLCLQKYTRRTDTVARLSSGQFGVVMPETGLHGALAAASKLMGAVRETSVDCTGGVARPEVCAGAVSSMDLPSGDTWALMDAADAALAQALRQGPFSVQPAAGSALGRAA